MWKLCPCFIHFSLSELMCVHTSELCLLFLHIQRLQLIGLFTWRFLQLTYHSFKTPVQCITEHRFYEKLMATILHLMFMMRNTSFCVCEVERVSSDQQEAYFTLNSKKSNIPFVLQIKNS